MATANMPTIRHPMSHADDPMNINVRGVSRDGARGASRQSLNFAADLDSRSKVNAFRPVTADQVPWRLTKSSHGYGANEKSPRGDSMGNIPEGIEVRRSQDPNKPTIPIFGK